MMNNKVRVAVAQFATTSNVQENLATCLRIINKVSVCNPSIIVLPEFCNTQPFYEDHNAAWDNALTIDGNFLESIAEEAKKHQCYIMINVSLRRDKARNHRNFNIKSNISITSCLIAPSGKLIYKIDKQNLVNYEKVFFSSSENKSVVIPTSIGNLAGLSGDDCITYKASRKLALAGAQLLCNSMSTYAKDSSAVHEPTRSSENNVFIASANKIGSLINKRLLLTHNSIAKDCISEEKLNDDYIMGIGQSQIISTKGEVLAKLPNNKEGFIYTDIDLHNANNKLRPDGTDLNIQFRPKLYEKLLLQLENTSIEKRDSFSKNKVVVTANIALFATYKSHEEAINDVCFYIENNLSDIIQLPALFFINDGTIINNIKVITRIEKISSQFIEQVKKVLRPLQYLCTSLVIKGMHQVVLISNKGIIAKQLQLHFCKRYDWTKLGDTITIVDLPLEQGNIKLAMLTADDTNIPEIVKTAALYQIELLLVPFDIQAPYEVDYMFSSRATENRICIAAASREKSFIESETPDIHNNKNKQKQRKSTGLIVNITTYQNILPQWKPIKFNGYVNPPVLKYQYGKITKAVIHPIVAHYK